MGSDKTGIGDRMKGQYEVRAQTHLPRRTYTILRLDGKAFHTYTRGLDKPWDVQFSIDIQTTAREMCSELQGCKLGYVQSDEMSFLLTDFATTSTDAWYDGNVQKIVSVASSIATAIFNAKRPGKLAFFDARVFTIPDRTEVENYFIWRQQDCIRNSIASLAQSHFSQKRLHGLKGDEMQELLWQEKDVNWSEQPETVKNGSSITYDHVHWENGAEGDVWRSLPSPVFTQHREHLSLRIPEYD